MSTGWSELGPDFLSVGEWAVGQDGNAPDRLLLRELLWAFDNGPTAKRLLEVGFGPCIDFRELNAASLVLPSPTAGFRYTGYDATQELVEAAKAKWPGGDFRIQDVLTMDDESAYDVVWVRHVLEHVSDGEEALRRLWRATRGCLVLSWFIRPSFTPSEVGCVIGDGFPHWTYDAKRWIGLATELGAHVTRIDFDHHSTTASVWIMAREPQPELAQIAHTFTQSPEFLDALLPVPAPVNEPYESALDILADAHTALNNLIPITERVPELERLADESHRVAAQVEEYLFPSQDEPDVSAVISPVRDLKARCEALQHWAVDERVEESQAVRDAARVLETRLFEAGRIDPPA